MASRFCKVFSRPVANVIAMIHVPALPGAPKFGGCVQSIIDTVCQEAELYSRCGVDGVLVENMHDLPYLRRAVGPETTAAMTAACCAVRQIVPAAIPCGIQILAGANKEAMAVAKASNHQFIRAEGFVFSHVADEGWMDADAGELMRYRRSIEADHVLVFCDIKKKHSSHAVTQDVSVADVAHAAEFFHSDGVILTGSATGHAARPGDLQAVQSAAPDLPVVIGSGITDTNFKDFMSAQAFVVGSHFKVGGNWQGAVCEDRVRKLVDAVNDHR